MSVVDLILNLAGLLLWVNWVLMSAAPRTGKPNTLLGTLRPAEPVKWRRWSLFASLPALLVVRAWVYWEIGSSTPWTPTLDLGGLIIAFRCDLFQRALAYSALSFGSALALFYLWLLPLNILNRKPPDPDPIGRFVRMMLGPFAAIPGWFKLVLPILAGILLWLPLSALLVWMHLAPELDSILHRTGQGALVGAAACLTWSHLFGGILLIYLVNSYVHLGTHPLWGYAHSIGCTFLRPFRRLPLQVGKVDCAPLVALGLIYLAARGGERLLGLASRALPW
ncbi:MAG: YggT family protein [Verrucomicrobia bacterium]|jgi:uncharacterized protein YggT (Ycf19 family)|nr:YggT family protein [Verrucomicrobiota bacterium]